MSKNLNNVRQVRSTTLNEAVQIRKEGLAKARGKAFADKHEAGIATLMNNLCTAVDVHTRSNGTASILNLSTSITQVSNVISNNGGKFEYFDLVAGAYPDFIAHNLIDVLPMKQLNAFYNYSTFVYGSNKGTTVAGDVALSPWEVNTDTLYDSEVIAGEPVNVYVALGDTDAHAHKLAHTPVKAGTVKLTITDPAAPGTPLGTGVDNGLGGIVAGAAGYAITGSINYATGEISITAATAPIATAILTADYEYDTEVAPVKLGRLTLQTGTIPLRARVHGLNGDFSLLAGFIYEAQFGEGLQEAIKKGCIAEIKRERDLNVIEGLWYTGVKGVSYQDTQSQQQIVKAGHDVLTWSEVAPTGVAQAIHDAGATKFINRLSSRILDWTQRNTANILVVGTNWLDLIKVQPSFLPTSKEISGVVQEVGSWNGFKIITNPSYRSFAYLHTADAKPTVVDGKDRIIALYKGSAFGEAAGVLGEFLTIVSTPVLVRSDLTSEQAFVSLYDLQFVTPNYVSCGILTH